MSVDDNEVKALESRLRSSGWAQKPAPSLLMPGRRKRRKHVPKVVRFGTLEEQTKSVAQQLADQYGETGTWPTYRDVSSGHRISYDDAVRAVAEAKHLCEEDE